MRKLEIGTENVHNNGFNFKNKNFSFHQRVRYVRLEDTSLMIIFNYKNTFEGFIIRGARYGSSFESDFHSQ